MSVYRDQGSIFRQTRYVWIRVCVVVAMILSTGCAQMQFAGDHEADDFPRYHDPESWPAPALAPFQLSTRERMAFPQPQPIKLEADEEELYSFVINNMAVKDGLRLFARAYDLNIVADEDVSGVLDVEFRDMSLERALSLMLASLDYYWEIKDGVIRVRSTETRQFTVDYLRLVRSGSGSSTATVSSSADGGGSGSGGGSGEGEESGSVVIEQEDEIKFFSPCGDLLRASTSTACLQELERESRRSDSERKAA